MSNKISVKYKERIIQFLENDDSMDTKEKVLSSIQEEELCALVKYFSLDDIEEVAHKMGVSLDNSILRVSALFDNVDEITRESCGLETEIPSRNKSDLTACISVAHDQQQVSSYTYSHTNNSSEDPDKDLLRAHSTQIAMLDSGIQAYWSLDYDMFMEECREDISAMLEINEMSNEYYVATANAHLPALVIATAGNDGSLLIGLDTTINVINIDSDSNNIDMYDDAWRIYQLDTGCDEDDGTKNPLEYSASSESCSINPAFVKEAAAASNQIKLHKPRKSDYKRN